MAPSRSLALAVALWAGLQLRREVRLTEDTVLVDAAPDEIVDRIRSRLSEGPDVLAVEHNRLVRRFSGRAGRFRYETVELVTYGPTTIGFEHLAGPFAQCCERFTLEHTDGGRTRMTHEGTFVLRGGLWTWPLARTAVKRAFEQHVHDHLIALRDELRASSVL